MNKEALELIASVSSGITIDDTEDPIDYLIDGVAEAAARLSVALQILLDATKSDEQTSLL